MTKEQALKLGESPNKHEAMSAIQMAQRLAYQHGLELENAEREGYEIVEGRIEYGGARASVEKKRIAHVLAGAFRVELLYNALRSKFRAKGYKGHFRVIGYPSDVELFRAAYNFTWESYCILRNNYIRDNQMLRKWLLPEQQAKVRRRLTNDYLVGFLNGLQDRFRQNQQEYGLVVVPPAEATKRLDGVPAAPQRKMLVLGNQAARDQAYDDAVNMQMHKHVNDSNQPQALQLTQ